MLWEVEILPKGSDPDRDRVCQEYELLTHAADARDLVQSSARGYLLEGECEQAGMERLTRRVGLRHAVSVVRADATALPFGAARFDACLSQEALLHVADKAAVLAEAGRVLLPGGRLAFSDWIAHSGLGDLERARLADWMAAVTLQ